MSGSKVSSLKEIEVPVILKRGVAIQKALSVLCAESIDECYVIICTNCQTNPEIYNLSMDITYIANVRPKETSIFGDLSIKLFNNAQIGHTLKYYILSLSKPRLLRDLFLKGAYSIGEIKSTVLSYPDKRFFFQPEIKYTTDYLGYRPLAEYMKNYDQLAENDFAKYRELLDYGWGVDTPQYYIKIDDVEKLDKFITDNGDDEYDLNVQLNWSPFECDIPDKTVTLIEIAAYYGSVKCFEYLLDRDCFTSTTTRYAVYGGNLKIIQLCEENEGDFENALNDACRTFRYDVFEEMIKKDLLCPFPHKILTERNYLIFLYRLSEGFDINFKSREYPLPLISIACSTGDLAVVEYLITKGAKVNVATEGNYPIHDAALNGSIDILKLLISRKADVNAKDKGDQTPLHIAAREGKTQAVQLLVENGAVIDSLNKWNQTPLELAANGKNIKTINYLLVHGANPNIRFGPEKGTLIHLAAKERLKEIAELAVSKGVDVNRADENRTTPLIIAVKNKDYEFAKFLLEHGADPTVKDTGALPPLHIAAEQDDLPMMRLLIEHGADVRAKSAKGFVIRSCKSKEAKEYIKSVMDQSKK